MSTVMVVDDEERIRQLLSRSLTSEGHVVVTAASGDAALHLLDTRQVDLILLDLVMPGRSGLSVLAMLVERQNDAPVIVISGVTDVGARVQALERGAVDVVAKPFSLAELLARVRRNLGGRRAPGDDRFLTAGGVRLDLDRRRARSGGADVSLTEREFSLLAHLMRRHGEVCRREELLHDVWGLEFDPGSNVVEVCVRRLRTKLGSRVPIETIRRVGYCFYED
ncbi:transcriptional regulator [Intrasporangium oryzae NRRL B-24470]|uniref:Transcriptional regulator n=1 Tax=Intrasporangium oryzae NRRL B-24470 TaxID=1386089 RepID=W9G911_9MICO|nr:response regulator transcription factor [Intrasporangium oryzae]EWT01323.1 transcriptional regulator [Intrasporangium oryzae NRRL B-24470]